MSVQSVAKLEAKVAKAQAKLDAIRQRYRTDPTKLARDIAKGIRRDDHAGTPTRDLTVNGFVHWYQGNWAEVRRKNLGERFTKYDVAFYPVTCPTTACVAGTAVSLAGNQMLVSGYDVDSVERYRAGDRNEFIYTSYLCEADDGKIREIKDVAADLLRLSFFQAEYLFQSERTKAEVLEVLDWIGAGEIDWAIPEYTE